ncbi:MAG: HDIG domain-containing protein [Candidatus Sumerlaeia bacterium]|nr:HDIG domain-containing protein [Candidatus Sumerlaeia bacterium]
MSELWDSDLALQLLRQHMHSDVLIKHCLASAAIMRALAERFGENADRWELAGLLHDLDFEETKDNPNRHGNLTAEILAREGLPDDIILAIREHNAEALGIPCQSRMGLALSAAETVTGLIVATALVQPDKKLAGVKPASVRKRMKEKAFARNVSRERILDCEKLGLSLDDFLALSVAAMQGIAADLGL